MKLEIVPFERVGSLAFGMKREKVREVLGLDFRTFRKSPRSVNTTDDYTALGVHLYYTEHDELEFVEMFSPTEPIFMGVNLLENAENTLRLLRKVDPDPETDEAGYTFHKIGIALYVEDKLEAVSAFRRGYYSST
jgi:hypothetical protein